MLYGSTTCVVKQSLVQAEQMTGNHKLCMIIDRVVKRFPTAVVKISTPYYKGTVKALCTDNCYIDCHYLLHLLMYKKFHCTCQDCVFCLFSQTAYVKGKRQQMETAERSFL